MPIKKSAFKALRQAKKRALKNKKVKEVIKNLIKKSQQTLKKTQLEEAKELIQKTIKNLDKAAQKGIIKKNTASRKKSRLMKKLNSLLKK